MSDLKLSIRINADGSAAVTNIRRVENELGQLNTAGRQAASGMSSFAGKAAAVGTALSASAVGVIAFSREVGRMGDTIRSMEVQMTRLALSGQGFGQIVRLADDLGMRLADATQAANFFAPTFTKMGKSFQDSTQFIGDLNRALQVYGVNGAMASSVTTQLAQGFSAGSLQGDELKSLAENAAGLYLELERAVQAILKSSDPIKQLGADGKLTSEVIYQAFTKVFGDIRGEFAKIPNSIEKEEARVGNAWDQLLSNLDKKTKASAWWQSLMVEWRKTLEGASTLLTGASPSHNAGFIFDAGAQQQSVDSVQAELERRREIIRKTQGYLDGLVGPQKLSERAMEYQRTIATETKAMDELGQTLNILLGLREREIRANATAGQSYEALTANLRTLEQASKIIPTGIMSAIKQIETGESLDVTKTNPSSGAFGLWQFMPDTAKQYGYGNTVQSQTEAAVKYVQDSIAKGGDSLENIFSSYVAGQGWRGAKRSEKAENYRQWYVAEASRIYKEWLSANATGNVEAQKQLGAIEKDESTSYERRLKAEQDFANRRAALIAERNGQEAKITASYAEQITAAKGNKEASPESISATVAELQRSRDFEIAKLQAATAEEARAASAKQAEAQYSVGAAYTQTVAPLDQYIAGLKEQAATAGLSAEQQARLNAEMETGRQIAAAVQKQKDLAFAAAQEAVRTGTPVDMSAADAVGRGIEELKSKAPIASDYAAAVVKAQQVTRETLPTIEQMWMETVKHVSKGIQTDLASAFQGLFDGTLDSADKFMGALQKTIISGLAQLAAAVAMRPINVVLNGVLGSTSGTSSTAAAGNTLLSSIGGAFTGNSIGSGLAGALYSVARPTSGGQLTMAGQIGSAAYSLPNWAYGASGVAGGLAGAAIAPNSPYGSLGGSLGGIGGMVAGTAYGGAVAGAMGLSGAAAGAVAGSVVPVVGTIIGAIAGAVLGGALGGGKDNSAEVAQYLGQRYSQMNARDADITTAQQNVAISSYYASVQENQAAYQASYEQNKAATEALAKQYQEEVDRRDALIGILRGEEWQREKQLKGMSDADRALQKMSWAVGDVIDAAAKLQSAWQSVADNIETWSGNLRRSMYGSSLASLRAEYQTQLVAAKAGDVDAAAGLTAYADRYLSAAQGSVSGSDAYLKIAKTVLAEVSGVGKLANDRVDSLSIQTGITNDTLQKQYDVAVKSAADALAYYQASGTATRDLIEAVQGRNITQGFAAGGIASGPDTGYPVMLHGTEAVIPLAGGSIPVQLSYSALIAEISALRQDVREAGNRQATLQKQSYDVMNRWDYDGMPSTRT